MRLVRTATVGLAAAGLAAPAARAQDPTPEATVTATPTVTPSPSPSATPERIEIPDGPTVFEFEVPIPERPRAKPRPTPTPTPRPARKHAKGRKDRGKPDAPGGEADGAPGNPDWSSLPAARISAAALGAFRIPPFLLPIYQAAGIEYGVRWEVLAAINEIETDDGRNLNVSSAGALGWMQFMPASWRQWGVDANRDGLRDPYNPVDAIFAAARYLRAAGADTDLSRAIFAYNHADWYVADVLERAREIAALPQPLVGALTGLAQGRFPVAERTRYPRRREDRSYLELRTRERAPVIAVSDGRIVRVRRTSITLQDAYGNRYTYARLGSVAGTYPVPRRVPARRGAAPETDAPPTAPATVDGRPEVTAVATAVATVAAAKQRLFAHPGRPRALRHGGSVQMAEAGYRPLRGAVLKLNRRDYRAAGMRVGARVLAGSILGRVGEEKTVRFSIRPAGRGAPAIDPRPILDGWRLLESTAVFHATNARTLPSVGQALLLGKPALQREVLTDPRLQIYPCGRRDIRVGAIDRRVLATLEFLAGNGMNPTVSSLHCGHSYLTASGNVSEHSTGTAVDIAALNGVPILGHQGPGSITDRAVRALLTLQGPMAPHQIITLMSYEGAPAAFALSDHDDHIHVGFRPDASESGGTAGAPAVAAGQWPALVRRLGRIEQPEVRVRPSKYALRG